MPVEKTDKIFGDGSILNFGAVYKKRIKCPVCGKMRVRLDYATPELKYDAVTGRQFWKSGLINLTCFDCHRYVTTRINLEDIVEHGENVLDVKFSELEERYRRKLIKIKKSD